MKTYAWFITVLLIWLPLTCSLAAEPGPGKTLSYQLLVRLDPEQQHLYGESLLDFGKTPPPAVVHLLLNPSARVIGVKSGSIPLPYTRSGDRLDINRIFGGSSLLIQYEARLNDQLPNRPTHDEDPSYGIATVVSPRGTFLSGGAGWYPLLPEVPARYRVRVEAPPGYVGITSGRLVEEGPGFSLWQTEHPQEALTLVAGPYTVSRGKAGDIPLQAYFYDQNQDLAETYLQATQGYLDLYSKLFGPYPFEKFAVVENFFPTGYGFPSWTLLGSSIVKLPFIVETSLGHEIAHSWWGNGVDVDYAQGNWAEGLTTYVADYLYKERSSATDAAEYRLKILRDFATLVHDDNDFPLHRFIGRNSAASQAIGYGKGAMLFHMLRREIGDTAFWEGLRLVAQKKMFGTASWNDFRQTFEATSGRDLKEFFDQWLERTGAPILELKGVAVSREGQQWQVSGSLLQQGRPYDLDVPIRITGDSAAADLTIDSSTGDTPFAFALPWSPARLAVDPDNNLFRQLAPEEIPPTVNGIRGSEKLMVVIADNLGGPVRQAALTLVAAFRQDRAPVVEESAMTDPALRSHDLLFIGLPSRSDLLPRLPSGLKLSAGKMAVEGKTFDSPSADLFAALPHPLQADLKCAIFLPASAESAAIAARKIPHYGKYSYLVFEQGVNRLKGTWSSPGSRVVHEFLPEPHHD